MSATTSTATIMFCDLVASTERQTRVGDDAADEFRRRLFNVLGHSAELARGTVVKSLGDGVMVVFRASILDALNCAVDMHVNAASLDPTDPPTLRIGLAAGEVGDENGDVFGLPVVEAARLCAAAQPGQTLATDLVRAMLGTRGRYHLRPIGDLQLKGIPDPVKVVEIVSGDGLVPPSVQVPPAPPLPPPASAPVAEPIPNRRGVALRWGLAGVVVAALAVIGGLLAFGRSTNNDRTAATSATAAASTSGEPSDSAPSDSAPSAETPSAETQSPKRFVLNEPSPKGVTFLADQRSIFVEFDVDPGRTFVVYWSADSSLKGVNAVVRVEAEGAEPTVLEGIDFLYSEIITSVGGTYRMTVTVDGTSVGSGVVQVARID